MPPGTRIFFSLPLIGLFLFSIFGGLASFEYTGTQRYLWLGIYLVLGLASLSLALRLLLHRPK